MNPARQPDGRQFRKLPLIVDRFRQDRFGFEHGPQFVQEGRDLVRMI
jgi:hypothetical protein